jgi:hypothetical protein
MALVWRFPGTAPKEDVSAGASDHDGSVAVIRCLKNGTVSGSPWIEDLGEAAP